MDKKFEKKEHSFAHKIKEGVSVEEIESFTRKHMIEVFLVAAIVVATFFSNIFWSNWLSIGLAGFAAIIGILLPEKITQLEKQLFGLLNKEEKTTQIIIGVVRLLIAFFLPFIIFTEIGLLAGCGFHFFFKKVIKEESHSEPKSPSEGSDEEHL